MLGQITDQTTHQPLPGVIVQIGSKKATSAADGTFRLNGVAGGAQTVRVHSDDVPLQRFSLVVKGLTTHADLTVCSATLDYHCAGADRGPGGG